MGDSCILYDRLCSAISTGVFNTDGRNFELETGYLPPKVVEVARETIRNFRHSKKVGNYLLGSTIGEGSFAKVREALHIPTGEKVAIKVIDKKKVKEDSYVRKNLRREGKILQMVRHPNVVQLYEIMETENSYYLVTELCKGGDLMDFICMKKKLEERETKRFIRQIICALDYLHRSGILHSGINMYAMLTGNLPFTVDPFNIKTLHNKMVTGKMNPMPDYISKDCRDLLKKFLNPDPDKRISLLEAMKHPWIAESRKPSPCPNKLKTEDLDENIMKHMVETQGFRMSEIIRFVTGNVPSPATAMYHIVHRKLTKYMADLRVQGKISAAESCIYESSKVTNTFQHSRLGGAQNRTPSQRHYTSHHIPFAAKPNGQNKIVATNKVNIYKHHRKTVPKPVKVNTDVTVTDLLEDKHERKDNTTTEKKVLEFTNLAFSEQEQPETPIQTEKTKTGENNKNITKVKVDKAYKYAIDYECEKENEKDSGFDSEISESPRKIFKLTRNRPYLTFHIDHKLKLQPHSVETQQSVNDEKETNKTEQTFGESMKTHQIQVRRFSTTNKGQHKFGGNSVNGYIRAADIKMTDGGKILGLSYLPSNKIQSRRYIQNGTRFSFDSKKVINRPKMKHYMPVKKDSDDDNSILTLPTETVSPLASLSKQVSSRATTHSMRSVSTKDSHVALPCISPTNTHRNQ
ncbi:hypothetical protein KUTeg_007531 [Tegillarca granosa]|uniref:Protein kinase domain-containing protein n=1 Tax=Tegillarca granosa TaxID=220873 RepID=A0ABQ9FDK8_TEGGR|nr:hypothetical protein KUTeg_007531 [Tegillarca granosa]